MEKVVIISGGTKGLGKSLVRLFKKGGWLVSSFGRSVSRNGIESDTGILWTKADMRFESDIDIVIKRTMEEFGPPNVLILNAGTISPCKEIVDDSILNLRKNFEINVFANTYLTQLFLANSKNGLVVHITSDVSKTPARGWSFYGSSKSAMDYIIRALTVEVPDSRFLSIDPGDMATEMHFIADPTADSDELQSPEKAAESVFQKIISEAGAV
ncbi:MAG: SDR family NAD(P)-dependent oxidoreductase [Candidatus Thermoplasmatota archaeon]|jgi:NAD(P)-dependent dehydrogenase (short-subunit alcohol dehydrogenase family)|nr:SDR family NAD(P)-dependent oxidoreductase [Candidatus Thermoplasmatota archaeon]